MLPCKTGKGTIIKGLVAALMVLCWVSMCLAGFTPGFIPVWENSEKEENSFVDTSKFVETSKQEKPIKGKTIKNSIGMTFVYINPGTFMMGSSKDELGRYDDEVQHSVTLTRGYYIQTTEVTQGQWKKVMGTSPSYFKNCGDDCPVENVSWGEALAFIDKLNTKEGHSKYRLPTEAEWEYACRAGSKTAIYSGKMTIKGSNNSPELDSMGWYGGNSGVTYAGGLDSSGWREMQYPNKMSGIHPVARKKSNPWGLYDMIGNVWEWCADWKGNYPNGSVTDPKGPSKGSYRVLRGGSWDGGARGCRSACRSSYRPDGRGRYLGFRLSRTP